MPSIDGINYKSKYSFIARFLNSEIWKLHEIFDENKNYYEEETDILSINGRYKEDLDICCILKCKYTVGIFDHYTDSLNKCLNSGCKLHNNPKIKTLINRRENLLKEREYNHLNKMLYYKIHQCVTKNKENASVLSQSPSCNFILLSDNIIYYSPSADIGTPISEIRNNVGYYYKGSLIMASDTEDYIIKEFMELSL